MEFRATFSRGAKSLSVSGQVHQQRAGTWVGRFTYQPVRWGPSVKPGTARLLTEDGREWIIDVTASRRAEGRGECECEFRVVSGMA
jgi:hypothetical protein